MWDISNNSGANSVRHIKGITMYLEMSNKCLKMFSRKKHEF